MTTIKWQVEGDHRMNCGGCSKSVEFSLNQVEGVDSVSADHETQQIEVQASADFDPKSVIAQLDDLGYQVRKITE